MDNNAGLNTKTFQSVNFDKLIVTYHNNQSEFDLTFKIRKTTIAQRWANKLEFAKSLYPIDDPKRFYGFGNKQNQIADSIARINSCIDTINSHEQIIDRKVTQLEDSDTLNYLHHIFEVYHGLLDQQTHEFFISAPPNVKKALADLNVLVHRCESVSRNNFKRNVITYYGLPKTDTLDYMDYELFEEQFSKGKVYLVYCEIGKTLKDLAFDDDHWITDEAYKPFRFFSADFEIYYQSIPQEQVDRVKSIVNKYYENNSEFFINRGLPITHPYNKIGKLPVADIDNPPENMLELLETHQSVKQITLIKESNA